MVNPLSPPAPNSGPIQAPAKCEFRWEFFGILSNKFLQKKPMCFISTEDRWKENFKL